MSSLITISSPAAQLIANEAWLPSDSCTDCSVRDPLELALLDPDLLMVLIHAKANDKETRDAIRRSWLLPFRKLKNSPMQYQFLIGGKRLSLSTMDMLVNESRENHDIVIFSSVDDSHFSLTQRTLEGFKYALQNFRFSYLMKCDDDSFVDLPRLLSELQERPRRDRLYWGEMVGSSPINGYGKYQETRWSVCDYYVPYALGGGYIVSRDLVELVVGQAEHLLKFHCEDSSVGAWLAPYNIERRHDSRFNTESNSHGCKKVFLVSHKVSPYEMGVLYQSQQLEGTYCSWRTQWFGGNGYVYNWTVPPTKCCHKRWGIP